MKNVWTHVPSNTTVFVIPGSIYRRKADQKACVKCRLPDGKPSEVFSLLLSTLRQGRPA